VTFNNSTSWIFESSTGDIFEILWGRTEEREDEDEEQVRWSALSEEEEEEDKEEERVPESTLSEEEEEEDGEEDGVNNGRGNKEVIESACTEETWISEERVGWGGAVYNYTFSLYLNTAVLAKCVIICRSHRRPCFSHLQPREQKSRPLFFCYQ
jgi:hypothetical protein